MVLALRSFVWLSDRQASMISEASSSALIGMVIRYIPDLQKSEEAYCLLIEAAIMCGQGKERSEVCS